MKLTTIVLALMLAACSGADGEKAPSEAPVSPPVRAGTATDEPSVTQIQEATMQLTSPAFDHQTAIPDLYTCEGSDVSPELRLHNIPAGTVSLALIMEDPDAPGGTWDHWVEFDIGPREIIPKSVGALGTPGTNSWGRTGYGGPCPPGGTHHYVFTLYALDTTLGLPAGATKEEVLAAINDDVISQATLIGLYSR